MGQQRDREFQIKQDGMVVAGACGPGSESHAMHYAAVYSQDGPVIVQEKVNGRWRNFQKVLQGKLHATA